MTRSRSGFAPLALTLTAAMVAVLAGCGGSSKAPTSSGTPQAAEVTATPGPDGVQQVTIDGTSSLRFVPATIVVAPGPVKVTLRNVSELPHDFVLDTFHASSGPVDGGAERSVTFTAGAPGTYQFLCSYHVAAGMKGQLIVR